MSDDLETEVPHHFEVGEELIKHDTSRWEVTKRLVDVDNDTVIYQLRESDVGPSNFTELMPEEDVIDLFEKPDAAEPELVTDGGRSESAISQHAQQLVENTLDRLPMVEWDRFVVGEDPNVGQYIEVYGWIAREEDSYKDFVLVRFFPETEQNLIAYTTSSDRHTKEIHRRIFDEDPDDHNECRRVENAFDIENAIELHEQQELVTDGGQSEAATAHAYCYDCDWYALPGDHDYENVMTATEAHTTFERGHTATVGASEEVVKEARKRAE